MEPARCTPSGSSSRRSWSPRCSSPCSNGGATMATDAPTAGRSHLRRQAGVVGQYVGLCLLAVVVLGPIYLTVIQSLSPPFVYLAHNQPLHPVAVEWKD